MVSEIVQRRLKALIRQRQRVLAQKPLMIKKNPLLDQRVDERHTKQHAKLVDKIPSNL